MPLISRRTYLKRRVAVFTSLALVLGGGIYIPTALLAPLDPVTAQSMPYATPASSAADPRLAGIRGQRRGGCGCAGHPREQRKRRAPSDREHLQGHHLTRGAGEKAA